MTPELLSTIKSICYVIGSVTFVIGLKMMGNAKTARKGNLIAAFGMILSILATIFLHLKRDEAGQLQIAPVPGHVYAVIFGAIALGTVVGWLTAKRVQMTKM